MSEPGARAGGPRPASRLASVTAYAPPGPSGTRAAAAKGDEPAALKLDANEGRRPDQALLHRLRSLDAETLRRYARPAALEAEVAQRLGVEPSRVVVTAGADDALERLCRATLEPGRTAVLTDPTFEMLPRYVRLAGAEAVEVPWLEGPFPSGEITGAIDDRTGAVFVVTPNNPTGATASTAEVVAVAQAAPRSVVVVDLAYVEFADEDPTPALLELPNVVMTRTFSKAWGLAGLRVGYAIGPAETVGWLRAVGHPYPTSGVSLALAAAALDADQKTTAEYIRRVKHERGELVALLGSLGAAAAESQGNFVLARVERAWDAADSLASRGVLVRRFPPGTPLADRLRITCPGEGAEFDRLCAALRQSLGRDSTERTPAAPRQTR